MLGALARVGLDVPSQTRFVRSQPWPVPNHAFIRSNVVNSSHTRSGDALIQMLRRIASGPIVTPMLDTRLGMRNPTVTRNRIVARRVESIGLRLHPGSE